MTVKAGFLYSQRVPQQISSTISIAIFVLNPITLETKDQQKKTLQAIHHNHYFDIGSYYFAYTQPETSGSSELH